MIYKERIYVLRKYNSIWNFKFCPKTMSPYFTLNSWIMIQYANKSHFLFAMVKTTIWVKLSCIWIWFLLSWKDKIIAHNFWTNFANCGYSDCKRRPLDSMECHAYYTCYSLYVYTRRPLLLLALRPPSIF